MGAFVSSNVSETGVIRTQADYVACVAIVRASSPRWCRSHDEFQGVADEVIAAAAATFEPTRGGFAERLAVRARSRVARSLVRSRPPTERKTVLVGLADAPDLADARATANFAAVESEMVVRAFIAKLSSAEERAVATMTAQGLKQAEIAEALDLHPRTVSRILTRMRVLAHRHFDQGPLACGV